MSDRDKKLLVYLGALIIFAAAYFLVAKPFLDKIDQLSTEKIQLQNELAQKREAFEKKDDYEEGIKNAYATIQEIIDRFPEDNSDEKSIIFAAKAEADIPIWFSQIKFAEETQQLVNGGEIESASDVEQQQLEENVAAAEGEIAQPSDQVEGDNQASSTTSGVGDLIGRDTEIGLTFQVEYDDFKKFLAYIRDYEDRIVIKDIDVTYSSLSDLVTGTMVLSQYAILGDGRVLPDVITDVDEIGTENIFKSRDEGGSIIDLIAGIYSDFINKIMGNLSEDVSDQFGTDYFIKANAVTDNTSGLTAGKADDPQETSYITSDHNDVQAVSFTVSGASGSYIVKYSIGDNEYEDPIQRDSDGKVYLRIISTERSSDNDKVAIALHVNNTSDIPVVVNVEGDDRDNPRFSIVERTGEVTVND